MTIANDRTGTCYHRGPGLHVFIDGEPVDVVLASPSHLPYRP